MKPKAHQELDLAKDFKDNKKGSSNNKRKTKDNVRPFLNGERTLVTEEAEELLHVFFPSVFTDKTRLQESLTQEAEVKECWKKAFPLAREDWVREHLYNPDIHKTMGPDGIHSCRERGLIAHNHL